MNIADTIKGIIRAPIAIVVSLVHDPRSIKFAHLWIRSLLPGRDSLSDQVPWITFKAGEWLDSYLKPYMRVFEYGSGGSTVYIPRRVSELISVEHDKGWYNRISAVLSDEGITNCKYILCESEEIISEEIPTYGLRSYTCVGKAGEGLSFKKYVKTIEEYPDGVFDLVFIDGVARPSCVPTAVRKVRTGGYLMLDDSEMPHYRDVMSFMSDYKRNDFFGINPYTTRFKQTSVWEIKPKETGTNIRP